MVSNGLSGEASEPVQPEAIPTATEPAAAASPALQIGDLVVVGGQLPYLKSADPMPMLRPPDLLDAGEQGQVVEIRALDQLAVRFRRGTFLLAARDLQRVDLNLQS